MTQDPSHRETDQELSRKALKSRRRSDAPSSHNNYSDDEEKKFDVCSAIATSNFTFNQFGSEVPGTLSFGGVDSQTSTSDVISG